VLSLEEKAIYPITRMSQPKWRSVHYPWMTATKLSVGSVCYVSSHQPVSVAYLYWNSPVVDLWAIIAWLASQWVLSKPEIYSDIYYIILLYRSVDRSFFRRIRDEKEIITSTLLQFLKSKEGFSMLKGFISTLIALMVFVPISVAGTLIEDFDDGDDGG